MARKLRYIHTAGGHNRLSVSLLSRVRLSFGNHDCSPIGVSGCISSEQNILLRNRIAVTKFRQLAWIQSVLIVSALQSRFTCGQWSHHHRSEQHYFSQFKVPCHELSCLFIPLSLSLSFMTLTVVKTQVHYFLARPST